MGKGLSSQQHDILAVLDRWPSYEQATEARPDSITDWARPRDIIERLGLEKNDITSSVLSRALARLYERGLVARASETAADRSFRYLRITNPDNARARGPVPKGPKPKRPPKVPMEERIATRIWQALIDAGVVPADKPLPPKPEDAS